MVLGRVAAHVQDDVGIAEIDPMVGHGAASERLSQSRYRGAVSDTGLVLDVHQPQGPEHLAYSQHSSLSMAALPTEAMPLVRLTTWAAAFLG